MHRDENTSLGHKVFPEICNNFMSRVQKDAKSPKTKLVCADQPNSEKTVELEDWPMLSKFSSSKTKLLCTIDTDTRSPVDTCQQKYGAK